MRYAYVGLAAALCCAGHVAAQPVSDSAAPPAAAEAAAPPATPAELHLAADTPVRVELAEAVSSKDRKQGDKFALKLAAPIVVDGRVVAPAGASGQGEVVYAEKGGGGGKPGKLVLAVRYVEVGGTRIRLKALRLGAGGDSEFTQMEVAAQLIGPAVMFMNGHEVVYPAGTRAMAKVAEEIVLPDGGPALAPPPVAAPTPAAAPASTPAAPAPAAGA
jgi:hypothetical protein